MRGETGFGRHVERHPLKNRYRMVAAFGFGSHGVLHFHDEQSVGGVVVGAGVVVRHSQHCISEQTLLVHCSLALPAWGVQTPLHAHDAQSVGLVVVVLWKQHCSLVHLPDQNIPNPDPLANSTNQTNEQSGSDPQPRCHELEENIIKNQLRPLIIRSRPFIDRTMPKRTLTNR